MGTTKQLLSQPALATPNQQANVMQPQQSQGQAGAHQRMAQLAINNIETGSPVVDQQLACDATPGAAGCVLSQQQRAYLLSTYQARVTAAQAQYVSALVELGVNELLKKEPEQSDWVMELMLDIIGDLTLSSVMKAFHALKGSTEHLAHDVSDAHALAEAMEEQTTEQVKGAVEKAVGVGKGAAGKAADKKAEENAEQETTQKTANIAFLDYLKTQSATSYENLRETAPVGLSDTSFLILFESFRSVHGHTETAYREAIEAKLKRFEKSEVGKLGVTRNKVAQNDPMGAMIAPEAVGPDEYQTRAFWVVAPSGERRLALFQREYKQIDHIINRGDVMTRHLATPFEEAQLNVEDAQREYTFVRMVPTEFEGAALSMHVAKFGAEPYEHKSTPKEAFLMGGTS